MMRKWTRLFYLTGALLLTAGSVRRPASAQSQKSPLPQHYYVADAFRNRLLQMDDEAGKNTVMFGEQGSDASQFRNPTRLFVDDKKRIYVCDTDNHRIVRMDDITGKNWTEIGSRGWDEKQFRFPVSIYVEPNDRITVLDLGNTRIAQMDDMNGKNWRTLDVPEVSIRFSDPRKAGENEALAHLTDSHLPNVVADAQGRLYYPDQKRSCVTRIDNITGKNPATLGTPGTKDIRKGAFYWPQMIGLDAKGRIYVLSVPGYLVRVDDMTGRNWTDLYGPVPGVASFCVVGGNTLCVTPFSGNIESRLETPGGKIILTTWKPKFGWFVDVFAR